MMVHERSMADPGTGSPLRFRLAVATVCIGIAAAASHGVAWADTGQPEPSGHSTSDSGQGPKKSSDGDDPHPKASSDTGPTEKSSAAHPNPTDPQHDSSSPPSGTASPTTASPTTAVAAPPSADPTTAKPPAAEPPSTTPEQDPAPTTTREAPRPTKPTGVSHQTTAESAQGDSAPVAADGPITTRSPATATKTALTTTTTTTATTTATLAAKVAAVATVTTASATTPSPPEPLSPIAQLIALPGRIINSLLQALDLTVAADGPKSPFDFNPIDELLFAAFRQIEGALGLNRTPAVQPVLLTQTYTGPTTAPTPTVAQFLNAAAAEYVLGGTPGGLQAFTVDGTPMASTNVLSGMSAQVWVTPQKQIIIAYQGTTGGTNLLFNPLIAITQAITDAQVILTNTTPQAFTDALSFQQRVQAAAALQGYAAGDIFVTGHSLGGWEAEYVAQQTGLGGIGFESPGINTIVPGNGKDSGFINVETYGDTAAYSATDLPGLQPFIPAYVPGGGSKPHYGSIVMIGDPNATTPLINASSLWGTSLIGSLIFVVDVLGNFLEHHLPGMQAYNLGITPDPGVVPWLGVNAGPVNVGWGDLTISQLKYAASQAGTLITP
ncbi:MAG: hypothetical protein QOD90_2665 [Mycobacterium sp.]|nr:hypothetical protein [Mycobacterium sp.]